ncbi:MAG: hypothetical protein M1435_03435, partial [Actinobacteria bacterium]|nr:hypothetical protein [Actinomycetota bacterium]
MKTGDRLGSYIQAWRHRLQPCDAGLPASPRRRTRGLRRVLEHLADLASLGIDHAIVSPRGPWDEA